VQDIKLKLNDETYIFFAELALLNDLPPEHFMVEAIETFKAYLLQDLGKQDASEAETDEAHVIYHKKIH
tara:strand:+ start:2442 stop:2648 length:207 start_codon:yes stop_codon:yes gene_type:complete